MADRKITELTLASATSLTKDDVVPLVSVAGTPITKKATLSVLFSSQFATGTPPTSNIGFTTTASAPVLSLVKATLTSNVNATSTAAMVAGDFATSAAAGAANTSYLYGIKGSVSLTNGAAVLTELAAGKLVLDVGNAASIVTNTYGLVVSISNTATRTVQPRAFLSLTESVQTNSVSTKYLFEVGQSGVGNGSSVLTANAGNTGVLFTTTKNTSNTLQVTHKLRICVNGTDYWLCVSNSA